MTFRTPGAASRLPSGRRRLLVPVVAILAVLVLVFLVLTTFYTDLLWYRAIDYSSVFLTELRTRTLLFVGAALLMAVAVGINMIIAFRVRPAYRALSAEQQGLERYRAAIDPYRRLIVVGTLGLLGLFAGASAAGEWRVWLAFSNRTSFGASDPQFNMDVSFFTFVYPFIRLVLGYLFAAVILAFIVAVITHYVYGGIRLQTPGDKATPAARVHLSVLLGTFVLLKAAAYWVDRWGAVQSDRGVVSGATYAEVNAILPAKTILAAIALVCALLFFANIWRRGAMLPVVGFGLLVLSAILIGGVYPALIQQFQVKPNEAAQEEPFIERNIEATRDAYDVQDAEVQDYQPETEPAEGELSEEASTVSGVRLLDPAQVGPAFQQLQQVRDFYRFSDTLDIDRYSVDGETQETVVALREIEGAPEGQQNWVNDHLVYTHGFGMVGASGSSVTPEGAPDFIEEDIPPTQQLGDYEPRIYFGERSPEFSIVGTDQAELDYPDESEGGQQSNRYEGAGGVEIGSALTRMLYAVKFQDRNVLISGAIQDDSRVLYDRGPRERVQKVAPYLTVDGDPYPAIVDGRIKWIVDAYTTSNGYPYSERTSLQEATSDSNTQGGSVTRQPQDNVNYVRNSVKATVDAYDGTVDLYQWNEQDPVLRTWMKAFPGTVKPKSEIGEQLLTHLRYPQDLFKLQRHILSRYHVTDAQAFYGGQDFWEVPQDPTRQGTTTPPYYLNLRMPGDEEPGWALTSAYSPRGRPNLAAYMSVNAEPGDDYGKIRVLQLPRNSPIQGPTQVQNSFEADTNVKNVLTQLRLGGTETVLGNLLTLPFGDGFLYVEPVYAQATTGAEQSYPLLKQVLVLYGNQVGTGATLEEALNQVFGGAAPSGDQQGQQGQQGQPTEEVSADVQQATREAQRAYQDGQDALKDGDFDAYGDAQQRLKSALDRLAQTQNQEGDGNGG